MKDGKEMNIYSQNMNFKSKDLSRILYIHSMNVDMYDAFENGVLKEPDKVIDNGKVKVKVYEFDAASYVIFTEPNVEEYTVYRCQENRHFCDIEMSMDLDALQTMIDNWVRITDLVDQPKIEEEVFEVKSNFFVYEYLYYLNQKSYTFHVLANEDGSGYVRISGTGRNIDPVYHLTKAQMEEFMEMVDSGEL